MLNDKQIAQAIINASEGKKGKALDAIIGSAVKWLKERRLISHWPKIRLALEQLLRDRDGRVLVKVLTRYPLGREALSQISRWCQSHLEHQVDLEEVIDSTIIGGFKLIYGDRQLDITVNNRLARLKHELLTD